MNWYLLNLPLAAAIATAVVAPIMVVMSRESAHRDDAAAAPGAGLDLVLVRRGAPVAGAPVAGPPGERQDERVLVGVG